MEQRSQFTFYESFFNALSRIKKEADRAKAYDTICAYALYGTEPDMDVLPDSAAIAFELVKPNLDSSRRKAYSGKKGGEKKQTASKDGESNEEESGKQNGSKTEAKSKQTASKKEDKKENKKENKKEKENECYNPLTPSQEAKFSPFLLEAVKDWLKYKHERKEDYKPTGLEAMTTEISNQAAQYGDMAVDALIRSCMANNWRGIIWDRITVYAGKQKAPAQYQRSGQSWAELAAKMDEEGL